ncbi:hypothetical protein, partial [Paenibacillus sp. FSL R7-269]|uniref:hypothetical protein n=1 Tax=Paenibacillus sp. FSL R7-269 TaxID=1226755 RepID=UPI001F2736B4
RVARRAREWTSGGGGTGAGGEGGRGTRADLYLGVFGTTTSGLNDALTGLSVVSAIKNPVFTSTDSPGCF